MSSSMWLCQFEVLINVYTIIPYSEWCVFFFVQRCYLSCFASREFHNIAFFDFNKNWRTDNLCSAHSLNALDKRMRHAAQYWVAQYSYMNVCCYCVVTIADATRRDDDYIQRICQKQIKILKKQKKKVETTDEWGTALLFSPSIKSIDNWLSNKSLNIEINFQAKYCMESYRWNSVICY